MPHSAPPVSSTTVQNAVDHALTPSLTPRDPWVWCLAIPALFALLASIRLTTPSAPFFDEVHYLPAARQFLSMWEGYSSAHVNREHPLLGKELIALGIYMFGDNPLGWRIMPLIAGTVTIGAAMRALWQTSYDRFAVIAFGVLLTTGFHLFVHARIAMLDIFMAAFLALAAWQFATAIREPERGRLRLALTGIAIGCALGAKWNAVPLAMAFGLTFFAARLSAGRRRLLMSRRGIPVPGISLAEAFLWLGVVPLMVYAITFVPGYWLGTAFNASPLAENGMIGLHVEMLDLQRQVLAPHTYQSTWPQWVTNTRGIWYHYEFSDGAQRGVLLIGNPVTMLLGLPALAWCLVIGVYRGDWTKIAVVVGYGASLGLWLIAPKPVQFYYHYMMPSMFLLAALAVSLSDLYRSGRRTIAYGVLGISAVMFAVFFNILTAAPLAGPMSFSDWTWIAGWR
ncbi:phospholipid carrier-dependent glycosyltransferase [Erythrobacter sp. Alg231-14]|uniref:phospholipid carrier-dependent glycosyltransferase n=1 Tax=Erythrobacter sp. Alg231-14 TaxID=1922225 RepID=UPI000D561824